MKNLIRLKESRTARPVWLSVWAAVVLAALFGAAGIVAGQGNAAPAVKTSAAHRMDKFKHPKLKHGELTIVGTEASDKIALRLQAGEPGILQVDVGDDGSADFSFARDRVAKIAVDAAAGDDLVRIDESNGVFTDSIPTTIDGGDGNDTIAGGKGNETLLGGDGNDSIDGNGGNDLALLGAGDDTFVWDPGDGSDTVEGQNDVDTMVFNGANAAEQPIALSANGRRVELFRNPGPITMDTNDVERIDINALGGADRLIVDDLSGTAVNDVNVDLAGTLGGATGDGQADRVVVNGTDGDDAINVNGDAGGVKVSGLVPTVEIFHPEVANDRLEINTSAGTDAVDFSGLAAGAIQLFVDGVRVR
jgi:Ca2+-binding RTX toxin-like protein